MSVSNFILDKLKNFVDNMNDKGIPIPLVRDPKTGKGSVSLTLVFISFNVALLGLIGKISGWFGGVDLTQAITLFGICAGLYWGRKFQRDGSKVEISDKSVDLSKLEE